MLLALEARDFRNLAPLDWRPSPGRHLILGDNGAGKTSLLEAIYLLATTRSFRTHRLADGCRHGADGFALAGEIGPSPAAVSRRLTLTWTRGGRGGQRHRTLDGTAGVSLASHLAVLPVLAWSAADADMLTGAPEARRRLLDRGIVGLRPAAIETAARLRQAMAEKRALLARPGAAAGPDLLAPWNALVAEASARLIALRADYVDRLRAALDAVLADCAALDFPAITLAYRPSPVEALDGVAAAQAAFDAAAAREIAVGQPHVGPQRDHQRVRGDGPDLRRVASAGERKALGIALLAAQGRVLADAGRAPILLLDDADTELDRHRLAALWRAFPDVPQVLATSNRPDVWRDLDLDRRWRCVDGVVDAD
ncbi:MAG: DNA replication and repair protein RecF [Acidobacteriota bacterium]